MSKPRISKITSAASNFSVDAFHAASVDDFSWKKRAWRNATSLAVRAAMEDEKFDFCSSGNDDRPYRPPASA